MKWPTYQSQDEIPDEFRDAYEEKGGEWRVKDSALGGSGGERLSELEKSVERLESSLNSERDLRKEAEKEAREAQRELDDLKQKGKAEEHGMTEEELEQLRADVRETVKKEYEDKYGDYDDVKSQNRKLLLEDRVKALALEHGVRGEKVDKWWKLHGDRFDLTEDQKPMIKGRPGLEIKSFISDDLKEEVPEWYEGTKMDGGGAGGDHSRGGGGGKVEADDIMSNPTGALSRSREKTA